MISDMLLKEVHTTGKFKIYAYKPSIWRMFYKNYEPMYFLNGYDFYVNI